MKLILVDKRNELPDVISFKFRPEGAFDWKAGQFTTYHLPHPGADERGEERYFTIASAPGDKEVQLTTRFNAERSSSFKSVLKDLPIGAAIEAKEPEGDFIVEDPSREMVWLAGGVGITPFRAILRDLDEKGLPLNITLLYANRDANFIFKDELDAMSKKHPTFNIRYIVSPEVINEYLIRGAAHDISKPVFYISGPEPMVEAFEKMLKEMGAPAENVRTDFFPGYLWP